MYNNSLIPFNNGFGPLKTKSGRIAGGFYESWVGVCFGILSGEVVTHFKKRSNCHASDITWLSHVA